MNNKDQMEEYIKYGISGIPEIKKEEKKKFLGEFKERVVLAVEGRYLNDEEIFEKIEESLKNQIVHKIIVNASLNSSLRGKCMRLAKQYHKDFKLVRGESAIAIVLASKTAINQEDIYIKE